MDIDIFNTGLHEIDTQIYGEDYYRYDLKRSFTKRASIINTNFNYVAFTGSSFNNTVFIDCILNNASLQCCEFLDSILKSTDHRYISGTNFSQSNITNSEFSNLKFKGSTFSQCYFMNTKIIDCIFRSTTFENSVFDSCIIENTTMAKLNMEYVKLKKNNILKNVKLSYYQVPYMIGFMDCFDNHQNSIELVSKNRIFSWKEYKDLLMDIARCLYDNGELYPVANILSSLGAVEDSRKIIIEGIFRSIISKDFRMINHFCNLGTEYGLLTSSDKKQIRMGISNMLTKVMSANEMNKYLIYAGEIDNTLTYDGTRDRINFTIYTNISSKDVDLAKELIAVISKVLDSIKKDKDTYSIKLTHNSDFNIILEMCTIIAPAILSVVYSVIGNAAYDWIKCKYKNKNNDNVLAKHKSDTNEIEQTYESNSYMETIHDSQKIAQIVMDDNGIEAAIRYISSNKPPENFTGEPMISSCNHRLISNDNYPLPILVNGHEY